nr:DNA polymerase family B [Moritella viscosa]SHO17866.1 DNA polymerase family B [Moritella viscosa]SHO19041.1 DNA polymerase family B [Moritella viscosa]
MKITLRITAASILLTLLTFAVISTPAGPSYLTGYIELFKAYRDTNAEMEFMRVNYCDTDSKHFACQGN